MDASGTVTLYSFTEIHRSFPGVATPVVLGWVDHAAGIRLLCRIDGVDATTLVPGTELELIDQIDEIANPANPGLPYWCRPISSPIAPGGT